MIVPGNDRITKKERKKYENSLELEELRTQRKEVTKLNRQKVQDLEGLRKQKVSAGVRSRSL